MNENREFEIEQVEGYWDSNFIDGHGIYWPPTFMRYPDPLKSYSNQPEFPLATAVMLGNTPI